MLSVLQLNILNGEEMSDELNDWFVQQFVSILRPHEVQVVPAVIGDLADKLGSVEKMLKRCDS